LRRPALLLRSNRSQVSVVVRTNIGKPRDAVRGNEKLFVRNV